MNNQLFNGKLLYYAFAAGSQQVLINQEELNRINVFPVQDKDTGTNLASTIRAVIDTTKPNKSYKQTMENIAEAALVGARGNSGVIFAQFLYGMSKEIANKDILNPLEFIESVEKSIPIMYQAVAHPANGTMLSVIKEWSEYLSSRKEKSKDFKKLLFDSIEVLEISLSETTNKLKGLKKYGFVDAGAKGFVVFIKGVIDFIHNINIRNIVIDRAENISLVHSDHLMYESLSFRYCTEAIIKDLKMDANRMKNFLEENGDSVVVAGSNDICRIHVHTNSPATLFDKLKASGTITYQKVDDMQRQQEMAVKRKWNIAIVTDSTCDLSQELIDYYQINVAPLNLSFGENHYLDKITIQPEQFYDLLETSDEFPTTSQINERTFTNLYSHLASHYDAVVAIHLTSQFSGTYLSSVKAANRIEQEFKKPIKVIDSKNLSGALGLLVLKAAQNIESGNSFESVVKSLESDVSKAKIYVSVRDLKYMIKGGRVSKPAGFVASLFGINPVISMDKDGKSHLFGNTFSQRASLNKIYRHIEKTIEGKSIWNYILLHAHNPEAVRRTRDKMIKVTGKEPISIVDISPVIGMHAGNGAIAVSLMFN